MKTAAIICEYNPFHNGHKFQIEETKRLYDVDQIVCIMSGNYVQRGDVAIFDKKTRSEAAIKGGAYLVLELPAIFSMQSAEFFALNAVKTLNAVGNIDFLSFGAEHDSLSDIIKIAKLLSNETKEFSEQIKKYISDGLSFPTARTRAVEKILGTNISHLLEKPNNILAIEYIKALIRTKSNIKPILIHRKDVSHDSDTPSGKIASASYVRELFFSGDYKAAYTFIPDECIDIYKNADIHRISSMEKAIIADIIKTPAEILKNISDVSEGLENRIKQYALCSSELSELCSQIKTKRYTESRIRRILLSAYLDITESDRRSEPGYIKILAHNENGQQLINQAKKTATLPIVRNTSQINKLKNTELKNLWEKKRTFDTLYDMMR